jgi:hypothetical protein
VTLTALAFDSREVDELLIDIEPLQRFNLRTVHVAVKTQRKAERFDCFIHNHSSSRIALKRHLHWRLLRFEIEPVP